MRLAPNGRLIFQGSLDWIGTDEVGATGIETLVLLKNVNGGQSFSKLPSRISPKWSCTAISAIQVGLPSAIKPCGLFFSQHRDREWRENGWPYRMDNPVGQPRQHMDSRASLGRILLDIPTGSLGKAGWTLASEPLSRSLARVPYDQSGTLVDSWGYHFRLGTGLYVQTFLLVLVADAISRWVGSCRRRQK
jgi:hypothetical protein